MKAPLIHLYAVTWLVACSIPAQAATLAYFDNFDDDAVGASAPSEGAPESGVFLEDVDSSWSVSDQGGGDHAYRVNTNITAHGGRAIASTVDFASTFASDQTFVMTTDCNVSSFTADFGSTGVGFGALGGNSSLSSGGFYLADFTWDNTQNPSEIGSVRLIEVGGDGGIINTRSIDTVSIDSADDYSLRLEGTVVGSSLQLMLTVENLTEGETATVSATDATPLTGGFFGYRNGLSADTGDPAIPALDATFDNFSVAVPEPRAAALLGLGALLLLMRRRRTFEAA